MMYLFRIFALMVVCLALPSTAQAGSFLDTFLGRDKDIDLRPTYTLRAPFAEPEVQSDEPVTLEDLMRLPENDIALEKPHRSDDHIARWVMQATSEALSFSQGRFKEELAAKNVIFSKDGQTDFLTFLNDEGFLTRVQSGQYDLSSYVEGKPSLLNEGAVGGFYKWLFEVPVFISIIPRNNFDYKTQSVPSVKVKLRIQIGRSLEAQNRDGVFMESWSGKAKGVKVAK